MFNFFKKYDLVGFNVFNLKIWYKILLNSRFLHYLLVGGSGVLIQLFLTWSLTKFIFGIDKYYISYSIALLVNLIYSFLLHVEVTFKSQKKWSYFIIFLLYSLLMTILQFILVRFLVKIFGTSFYLMIISLIILFFSIINFIFFKFKLFR